MPPQIVTILRSVASTCTDAGLLFIGVVYNPRKHKIAAVQNFTKVKDKRGWPGVVDAMRKLASIIERQEAS